MKQIVIKEFGQHMLAKRDVYLCEDAFVTTILREIAKIVREKTNLDNVSVDIANGIISYNVMLTSKRVEIVVLDLPIELTKENFTEYINISTI